MIPFLLRRLASSAIVLFCVITITFFLIRIAPGGPFSRERKAPPWIEQQQLEKYQLSGSLWKQYTSYLSDLSRGDLRVSFKYRDQSVKELIAGSMPVSAILGSAAFLIASIGGIWLGSMAAIRHHTPIDAGAMFGALFLISIPAFVTGPVLILAFAIRNPWLPVGGWNSWSSLVLPSITLAGPYVAYVARLMRSSMLEVLGQDFVRTARAKGLAESRIIYKHALKVAILPVISFLGPLAAHLLTGSLIVETIFSIPGAGPFFINAILNNDVFLLEGVVIVYCALLVLVNLAVDIAYTWLDPRISFHD